MFLMNHPTRIHNPSRSGKCHTLMFLLCCYDFLICSLSLTMPATTNTKTSTSLGITQQLSLVTWNVLSPIYATPNKYPWVAPQHLNWEQHREKLIIDKLVTLDADVICLQEMQVTCWDSFAEKMNLFGYDGVLQKMKNGHPVANAVLVKRGIVEVVRTESRSRAFLTVLRRPMYDSAQTPLFLANVHLEASAEKDATRVCQLRSLFKRLKYHCEKENIDIENDDTPPIVIAGDMNMLYESEMYDFLAKGSLPSYSEGSKPADVLLPFQDAYQEVPSDPPLKFTYGGGMVLDYVWASKAVNILRTMPPVVPVQPVGTITDNRTEHSDSYSMIPSEFHASDHFPIGVCIGWPDAPMTEIRSRPTWQQQVPSDKDSHEQQL